MEGCGKNETITEYLRRMSQYKAELKKSEYDISLSFLNDILELTGKYRLKSITDFKNIRHVDIIKDIEQNKKIITDYSKRLKDIFFLELTDDKIDDMNEDYIIDVIKIMINNIGYKLIKKKYKSGYYYFIKLQ